MSGIGEGEPQDPENKGFTEHNRRAKDLFFQSFRFSQGDTDLQGDILKWLVAQGYYDEIDVPEKLPAYIQEIVVPKKHPSFVGLNKLGELERVWDSLYMAKARKQSLRAEKFLAPILYGMIDRDREYQKEERPKRPHSEQVTLDSSNDPHASFIRKHIINTLPTGNDAFDELHRSLAPLVIQYWHVIWPHSR